jgi:hypothetical protein
MPQRTKWMTPYYSCKKCPVRDGCDADRDVIITKEAGYYEEIEKTDIKTP